MGAKVRRNAGEPATTGRLGVAATTLVLIAAGAALAFYPLTVVVIPALLLFAA